MVREVFLIRLHPEVNVLHLLNIMMNQMVKYKNNQMKSDSKIFIFALLSLSIVRF